MINMLIIIYKKFLSGSDARVIPFAPTPMGGRTLGTFDTISNVLTACNQLIVETIIVQLYVINVRFTDPCLLYYLGWLWS